MCPRRPAPYIRGVDIINDFILQAATSPWLLLAMFMAATIDGFFPPIPSETVLVAAVAVAATTDDFVTVFLLCLVAATGAVIGDNIAYRIGNTVGVERFRWMRHPRVAAVLARTRRSLDRRGTPLILGARYVPVGRVAVNMTAGAVGYPWPCFLLLSTIAGIMWAVYSSLIGVLAGHWLGEQPLLSAILGVVFAIAVGMVVDRIAAASRQKPEASGPSTRAGESPRPRAVGV